MPPPLNENQEEVLNDFWYNQNVKVGIRKLYELINEENNVNILYRQGGCSITQRFIEGVLAKVLTEF